METEKSTRHFEVIETNPQTGIITRRVIKQPSDEFDAIIADVLDGNNPNVQGTFVANDIPLGMRGRGKEFHFRLKRSKYDTKIISYELRNESRGDDEIIVQRFIDFKDFVADGFTISVRHTENDGDLLEVDLQKSKFAPTDNKEVNRIRWVLRAIQKFNNELLTEVADQEDADEDALEEEYEAEMEQEQAEQEVEPASPAESQEETESKKPVTNGFDQSKMTKTER